jgi:hypothetical protein
MFVSIFTLCLRVVPRQVFRYLARPVTTLLHNSATTVVVDATTTAYATTHQKRNRVPGSGYHKRVPDSCLVAPVYV